MSRDDHHEQEFDGGTRRKLFIYQSYLQAWLQVFIHTPHYAGRPLQFFDLFAGPGQDAAGNAASPIILMDELEREREAILQSKRPVNIFFNDYDAEKTAALRQLCIDKKYSWPPTIDTLEFGQCYANLAELIGQGPSLVFLDQFGVKFVTKQIFAEIASRPQTDLLFFFASSHQRRFDGLFANELRVPTDTPYTSAHRIVADQFRRWAPSNYFVGHFSIKKGSNVYGLIFGSGHSLGMFKFLEVAWKVDPETGEADFPIDAERYQGDLFLGFQPTKLEAMRADLLELVRARKLVTDGEVVLHCITGGVLPNKVVPDVYRQLKTEGIIRSSKANMPRYSHDAVDEPRAFIFG